MCLLGRPLPAGLVYVFFQDQTVLETAGLVPDIVL